MTIPLPRRLAAAVALSMVLFACEKDSTETAIRVIVDSDLALGTE